MLPQMNIEHEVDQRACQPCTGADVHRETGARDLRTALQVNDPQRRAQIPVRLPPIRRLSRAAPRPDVLAGGLIAGRHSQDRCVGDLKQKLFYPRLTHTQLGVVLSDPGRDLLHLADQPRRILARLLSLSDLLRCLVAARFKLLHALDQTTPFLVKADNLIDGRRQGGIGAFRQLFPDSVSLESDPP